jgi:hypothetical protein
VVAVRYRARIEAHWNGGNDRGLFWHTDIYERRNGRWQALVSGDADPGADLASGGVLLTSPGAPFPTRVPTACERRPAPLTTVGTAAVPAAVSWVMAETGAVSSPGFLTERPGDTR